MEREIAQAPSSLGASDCAAAQRLFDAVRGRIAELEEVERGARIANWQQPYLDVGDVAALDHQTSGALLRVLDTPPCTLLPEEQEWRSGVSNCLTAHLDQLSIDDLVSRIERLSQPMRQALFKRLSQLMTA